MTRMRPRAALPATPLYSLILFATSPYSPLTPLCSFAPFLYSAAPARFTVCGRCLIYASLPEVTFTPALGTHCAPATAAEFDALTALLYANVPLAPELENKGVCAAHSRRCAHRPPKLAAGLEQNCPQHSRARNTLASRPILATPSPESTKNRAKGTNSRREPPSAPESLTSCTPSLAGIKTGLFWYSAAMPAAPGAPCALKGSSQPSCPRKPRHARNIRGGPLLQS